MAHFSHPFSRKARNVLGLLALSFLVGAAEPALAQSDDDVEGRMRRIESDLETLNRAVYSGNTSSGSGGGYSGSSSGTDTEVRLQQFENDIRELRGKLEEQSFEIRQIREQTTRVTSDLELRMNELEGGRSAATSPSATVGGNPPYPTPSSDNSSGANDSGAGGYQWGTKNTAGQLGSYGENPSTGTVSGAGSDTAADLYENSFSLLKGNSYDQAQAGFQQFMDKYPEHELAGNAKYWLGETYYVRGKYDEAARIFAEGYQKYPKSAKSADNLLKLGLSLDALGKKDDACIAFRQLGKENLTGAAPVMRRAEQEMTRLGCQ